MSASVYYVTVRATVTKTFRVETENEEDAIHEAHERFTCTLDDQIEDYEEETLWVTEVSP